MKVIDIAIAGGGPGGLATAAAVIAAFGGNVKVKVGCCERRDMIRTHLASLSRVKACVYA